MPKREDGKATKKRLLEAANQIFAQKGYRDAKITDICKRANANVASVNYYFRDKANLYVETWLYSFQKLEKSTLLKLEEGRPPHELLREYIFILIKNFTIDEDMGNFSRLYMMELVNPTGLIRDSWHKLINPQRRKLHNIIRAILGHEPEHKTILFCELSIINQCRALFTTKQDDLEYFLEHPLDEKLIRDFADHIVTFSLAGINAVGQRQK